MGRTTIPLRIILITTFVLQSVTAVGFTTWLAWNNEQRSMEERSRAVQADILVRIRDYLEQYAEAATVLQRLNQTQLEAADSTLPDSQAFPQSLRKQRLLFEALPITALFLSRANGTVLEMSLPDRPRSVSKQVKGGVTTPAVKTSDTQGVTVKQPWLSQIQSSPPTGWSGVYQRTPEVIPRLTFTKPLWDAQKRPIGVVGVEFSLEPLSRFLQSLVTPQIPYLILVDAQGQVVGTSTLQPVFRQQGTQMQRIRPTELSDPLLRRSLSDRSHLLALKPEAARPLQLHFTDQGNAYSLWTAPLQSSKALNLQVVAIVPQPSFWQQIPEKNREGLMLGLVVLMTAILFSLVTARRLSQGLRELIQAGERLAIEGPQGFNHRSVYSNFESSRIEELSSLARAFNRMADHLRRAFDDLEARVEERAAALQQSEEKFAKIFYTHPNPITITRLRDGCFVDVNDSAIALFGLAKTDIIGKTSLELQLWANPSHLDQVIALLRRDAAARGVECSLRTRTGDIRTVLFSAELMRVGRERCVVSTLNDISDRRRAEQALQQAKAEAEAANQAKSIFLSNMSHELRTPLNAILGFTQVMNRDVSLSPTQRSQLDIINRSGAHLLEMINEVLDIAKIESGRMEVHYTSFDLHRLLDTLERMFSMKVAEKGLVLLFERSPTVPQFVKTDEGKLRQILINLIGNAIKFTEVGHILIRTRSLAIPAQDQMPEMVRLLFEVEDTGIGIAPTEFEAIFETFVQSKQNRQPQAGTGLGLPICREFAHLLGGDISVASTLGRGSLFQVDIAVEVVPATEQSYLPRIIGLAPEQQHYRILIADDRWESRQLMVQLLEPLGLEVREAQNGVEAVEGWKTWNPHLIWMDMRMPIMDGYQATQQIKATPQGQETTIIALTASALHENTDAILAAGCDAIIHKPFREEVIFEALEQHLGIRFAVQYGTLTDTAPRPPTEAQMLSDLQRMPTAWLQEVHQAAQRVDNALLLERIGQLSTEHHRLRDALAHLVQNFRCDLIFELTEPLI